MPAVNCAHSTRKAALHLSGLTQKPGAGLGHPNSSPGDDSAAWARSLRCCQDGPESQTKRNATSFKGFPGGSAGKKCVCHVGNKGSVLGGEEPLEEGMATDFSSLVWEIPWTEEPGGLQSVESKRVGHN